MPKVFLLILFGLISVAVFSQTIHTISGIITEETSGKPIANATVHLKGTNYSTLSKADGSFKFRTTDWYDSLQVTCVSFEHFTMALQQGLTQGISVRMKNKVEALGEVVVSVAKKPGKSFMQKVINHKANNNPSRFQSYSYQRYTRTELDLDHIDYVTTKGNGLKSLLMKTYAGLESSAISDKELPIYFAEQLANNYHSVSPTINRENIIAKKNLGLKTDNLLSKLDKFYFNFNVYDNWIPIFDQTYVSPLNSNAY